MILSLIIPVYNVEKYIRKTLSSIYDYNRLLDLFEVVVINDGTKDDSMRIVLEFASKYKNITIINQENKGLSAARNAGLRVSRGKYVWFVDSDDWVERGAIDKICSNGYNSDAYLFRLRHFDENDNEIKGWSVYRLEKPIEMDGIDVILNNYPYTPMQSFLIRRNLLVENNLFFYEGIYHEDQEFAPKVLMLAKRVTVLPDYMYCYLRRSNGSIMSDAAILEKRKSHILIILDEYKKLLEKCDDLREKKALVHCCYDVVAGLFGGIDARNYSRIYKRLNFAQYLAFCKRIVLRDTTHNRRFGNVIKRLLFIINPRILVLIGRSI